MGVHLLETLKNRMAQRGNRMAQRDNQDKDYMFLKNGSLLFEALIASTDGKYKNPIRIFSSEELMEATNNYDHKRIILEDREYILYKGNLESQSITVKKFICISGEDEVRLWINDAVNASRMIKHKNVVKLLGCCLETSIPILVYEFMPNGSLEDHLFGYNPSLRNRLPLSFETRLKIAVEIANAVTYLHTEFERPIILMGLNIKTILLDQHCIAKLGDFTLSISIPKNETRVEIDGVTGIIGWLAPEMMTGNGFTEKLDVYSFGILLFVLFTGQKAIFDIHGSCLIDRVKTNIENSCSNEMVDPLLRSAEMDELKKWQLRMAFELAVKCAEREEELRPTMMDAAKEIRRIQKLVQPSSSPPNGHSNDQRTTSVPPSLSPLPNGNGRSRRVRRSLRVR